MKMRITLCLKQRKGMRKERKKYQMSAVTMGSGGSSSSPQPPPPPYEPDQALMKIREQHANFTEITRQLRDWTRNATR
ncbi:hypothetical protein PIB30_089654, partial [Stylosanthes scabra]|nr:hypothetical protein [Stylosanthes scabra]